MWLWDPWVLVPLVVTSLVALAYAVALGRFAVSWSVVAKGDPSGAWALVCGLSSLGVSLTFVAAEGVPAHFILFVLGRRVTSVTVDELREMHEDRAAKPKKPKKPSKKRKRRRDPETVIEQLRDLYGEIAAWMDPVDAIAAIVSEHRRIRLDWLSIDTRYGFRDPILTGQITAALYVLDGLLPARITLVARPDWDAENRASLQIEGRATLFPGRFAWDMADLTYRALVHRARFAWQHKRLAALPPSPEPPAPDPREPPRLGESAGGAGGGA